MSFRPSRRILTWNSPLTTIVLITVAVLVGVLLGRLPILQGLVFVGLFGVLIGTLIEPFVGLAVALFLGPLKAYLSAYVPYVPAQIAHAFVALALGAWLAQRLSERDLRIRKSSILLAFLILIGAALLSLWDGVGVVAFGTLELIKWLEMLVLFVFVSHHLAAGVEPRSGGANPPLSQSRRFRWLLLAVLSAGLFQAVIGIWQFGLRGDGPDHFAILGGDFFRAYGTFEQPNPYAGYMGLTAALALGMIADRVRNNLVNWWEGRHGSTRTDQAFAGPRAEQRCSVPLHILATSGFLFMLIALGASWSRGAWIGFGAAGLVITAALPRKLSQGLLLSVLLVIGGLALYQSGQLPTSFTTRLTSFVQDIWLGDVRGIPINDANYAVVERLAHWQAALSMFRHNFWSGVGFGGYEAAYSAFALINWPIALGHAHNYYLNLLGETGLIGLLAYGLLWSVVFWQTWRVTRVSQGLMRGVAVGLLGTWTHLTVHHLLDNLYVNNIHLHIGVLLGILAFIVQQTRQEKLVANDQ